jgi:hypothetical protein
MNIINIARVTVTDDTRQMLEAKALSAKSMAVQAMAHSHIGNLCMYCKNYTVT